MNLAEESIPAGEAVIIQSMVDRLQAKITRDNALGMMRRDAHPKMHGLLKATFTVEPGLPPELRVGVFAQPQTFRAWVRFSNQDGSINADSDRDMRGMAIKLMGVPGTKDANGPRIGRRFARWRRDGGDSGWCGLRAQRPSKGSRVTDTPRT